MVSKAQLAGGWRTRRAVRLAVVACGATLLIGSEYVRGQGQLETGGVAPIRSASHGEDSEAARELKLGSSLTREGKLQEAIPHLLSARSAGASTYAAGINLGICYIGTGRYSEAIAELEALRTAETATAAVHYLLAQAYLGDGQVGRSWDSFLAASALTPKDEKLYAYMADACTDQRRFEMGLRAVDVGIGHIPGSARLHYERGLFLAQLGRLEDARPEWDRAAQLTPGSYIATLSLVQRDLYDGKISEATERVLAMVSAGNRDHQTLSLLGTVLLHAGAVPGDPNFARAQEMLEEAARSNPEYSATQIALGRIYILEERYGEAVEHLEIGRRLEPRNPAVYSNLARAYHHLGNQEKSREMNAELGRLLEQQNSRTEGASAGSRP
jgi:predicted Zn-dependent protease